MVQHFRDAADDLRLPFTPDLYQLRHSGASADLLEKRRELPMVTARGRWLSDKSVRRYGKPGQVQRSLARLSADQLAYCSTALADLEQILLGLRRAPVPPWLQAAR